MPVRASTPLLSAACFNAAFKAAFLSAAGCLVLTAACQRGTDRFTTSPQPIASSSGSASSLASPEPLNTASQPAPDLYAQAIDRAKSAFVLSRSAQSRDDWQLVTGRWQQAIGLMTTVSPSDPRRSQAQQKLGEYRRSLAFAQQQASRSTAIANPDGVIVFVPQTGKDKSDRASGASPSSLDSAASQATPQTLQASQTQPSVSSVSGQRTFSVPIIRRAGNTPVVNVRFNDSQTFEMIVDTGASGTLITRSMADALKIVPIAQTSVDTASARNVKIPLGYVDSMNVGGATAQHVLVAIAGSELSLGLLGHDFFGNYDVTIRESRVEFQER